MNAFEELGNRLVTLRRAQSYAAIVVLVLVVAYSFGLAQRRGLIDGFGHVIGGDLLALRTAGQIVREGNGARLYDFALQAAYQQRAVDPEQLPGLNPFITPPFVAVVYWPWSFLPQGLAFATWTALALAALGVSVYLAMRRDKVTRSHLLVGCLVSLSFFPVLEGLMAGNLSTVSLLVFTLMFLALKAGRETEDGGLLGLQLVKPQLVVVLLVVLAYKRRWRALLGFGVVAAIWAVASILLVDQQSLVTYATLVPQFSSLAFVDGFPYALLTSMFAFFLVPLGPDHFGLATAAGTLASVGILGLLLRAWSGPWRVEASEFDLRFAGTLVATCLISQYVLLHDLTILILAVVLLTAHWLGRLNRAGWGATRATLAVVWIVSFLGPLLSVWLHVQLVPLALLLLGGVIELATHSHTGEPGMGPIKGWVFFFNHAAG